MIDHLIRFRHLRTALEVARQKSVGRAAAALHISQPAVTKTIRELEFTLGVSLFERDGRGMRATREGETFLRHAAMAVAAVRQGVEAVAIDSDHEEPPIRIGALPTVSARIMPRAMALCLQENRNMRIRMSTGENTVLLGRLRLGELDLVVGRLAAPEEMKGFLFEHLYSEKVVFVVRNGHPLLEPDADVLARLGEFPVLMPERGSIIRPVVERFLIASGVSSLPWRIETISADFGRAFLRVSDAVWLISEGVVANDLADGVLAALPIDTDETKGAVGLTMRTELAITPPLQAVLRAVREASGGRRDM